MRSLRLQVLATAVDLHVREAHDDVEVVERAWARCERPEDGGSATSIELDSTLAMGAHAALASRLTRTAIEGLAGRQLLFHAAGVAADDGRVVVLVGPSGAGKSTATAELCRETFGYVTDETVAVDDQFSIVPFPKPLLIRQRPRPPKDVIGPDELGLRECPSRPRASRVVLLRRDGSTEPRLEDVGLAEGLLALIPETSALGRLPAPLQTLCRFIEHCGGVRALHYAEIADAADLWATLLEDGGDGVDAWHALVVSTDSVEPGSQTIVATPVDDAVQIGDDVVLLKGGRPYHLRGIGATIWAAAASGATTGQLSSAVAEAHGPHPDEDRLVGSAVEAMLEHGVLERV